jgi:hypothetical protein
MASVLPFRRFDSARLFDHEFEDETDYYDSIRDSLGFESYWRVPGIADFNICAYRGEWTLHYDGGCGRAGSRILLSPTWYELWQAADLLIRQSGDLHHLMIEDFDAILPKAELELLTAD